MNNAPITPSIGSTEREILDILWERSPLTIRQVRAVTQQQREIAYTTLLTTSGRMEEKGLLVREITGAAYNSARILTPALSRADLFVHAVTKLCAELRATADDRASIVASLQHADA